MEEKYKLTGVGCMKCVAKIEKNLSDYTLYIVPLPQLEVFDVFLAL